MGIENFIREALRQPHDYIAYHVGRELAELHPGKTILEGQNWYFDLEAFVHADKCSVVEHKSVFHHVKSEWEGTGKKLKNQIQNSWLSVLWKGQLFDLVLITWSEDCYRRRHHWIVAQPCLYIRSFKAEYGTEQDHMAEVFKRARMTTPCLMVMEDLDSMIDANNRAFFLNELDGFESNTGVVVLATTNHPEKLDPAILDRPSRFDRKYYFQLPEQSERLAYIAKWNEELQPELRVSASGAARVVRETDGFSFAYLKELFVASMVQWMSSGGRGSMDAVILAQAQVLRGQMKSAASAASA